jgi:hypothetical protein
MVGVRSGMKYERGVIDVPSVFIVVLGIGLWSLWATLGAPMNEVRSVNGTTVRYIGTSKDIDPVKDPELVARGTDVGKGKDRRNRAVGDSLAYYKAERTSFLNRDASDETTLGPISVATADRAKAHISGHASVWSQKTVVEKAAPGEIRVLVHSGARLQKSGFKPPEITVDELKDSEHSWQVSVDVHFSHEGQVTHVLLAKGCSDAAVNAMVVRKMHFATLARPGGAVHDRVTVSCGRN